MLEETLRNIKNHYHEILRSDPEGAVRAYQELTTLMKENKIIYAGKPVPVMLEPGFFPSRVRQELENTFDPIQKGIDRIINIVLERNQVGAKDDGMENAFDLIKKTMDLRPEEIDIMQINCGTDRNVSIYRLDLYLNGGFQILEFNTDSAAGIIDADIQTQFFLQLAPMQKLSKSYRMETSDGARFVLNALLDSKYPSQKEGYSPTICLTDWRDVDNRDEQENLIKYFRKAGYNTLFSDPRDFTYRKGRLYCGDEMVDIINRRVILKELLANRNEVRDLIDGARDGAVSVINPFASAIGSNKAILAVLSDDRFRKVFDEDTWRVMTEHLPWTRVVHHLEQNEMQNLYENKNAYVLKQCRSYGGEAVIVGNGTKVDEWKKILDEINMIPEEPWVVQKYIKRSRQIYPTAIEGRLEFKEIIFNVNPFIVNGEYSCGTVRLSTPDLYIINVSRGGAQLPMITFKSIDV